MEVGKIHIPTVAGVDLIPDKSKSRGRSDSNGTDNLNMERHQPFDNRSGQVRSFISQAEISLLYATISALD